MWQTLLLIHRLYKIIADDIFYYRRRVKVSENSGSKHLTGTGWKYVQNVEYSNAEHKAVLRSPTSNTVNVRRIPARHKGTEPLKKS